MTVIRPNSISGITSITAQANEINVFRSNGLIAGLNLNGVNFNTTAGISTLAALKVTGNVDIAGVLTYQDVTNVDSLGIGTFRTGINVSGGQLDVGSNIKLGNAGVITATSFVGSGANLTGLPAGTTINNNANNRIITGSGTANTLEGEANMRFDGATLTVDGTTTDTPLILTSTNVSGSHMRFQKDGSNKHFVGSGGGFGLGDVDDLSLRTVDNIIFGVGTSEKLRITSGGSVNIGGDYSQTSSKVKVTGTVTVDGGLALSAGSFTAPGGFSINSGNVIISGSIAHDADSDTLFGFGSGADTFSIQTAGTRGVYVDSSQRTSISKNGWTGSDMTFGLTVHTGSTSASDAVNDGIMIVSQNNNGNQNSSTGKLMFCGHAQTNGPFLYGDAEQAYGKKGLVFHTHSTANSYSTQLEETMRLTYQGYMTMKRQPGFGASNMNGWSNISGSTYAVTSYGTVHHNYGSHFNSSNGRFTAPVDGRYLMTAIGMGVNNSAPHIAFGINNSSNGGGPSRGGTNYGNNNMWSHPSNSGYWVCLTHILDLSANDYVRVYTYDWNSSQDAPRTYFYGYLLG